MRILCILPLLLAFGLSDSLRILGIFPTASYSHYTPGATLMNALVDRGHDVTIVAAYQDKSAKFKTVHLVGTEEKMEEIKSRINMFEMNARNWYERATSTQLVGYDLTQNILENPNMKELLSSDQKFDVVILEQFINEALQGICHHYSAACVMYSATPALFWTNAMVANPENPSYVPQMSLLYNGEMGFCDRLKNTLLYAFAYLSLHNYFLPRQGKLMKQHFPKAPPLSEIYYEKDLILLNSHPAMSAPIPHVPSMIEIGGFHVKPTKKLPEDLQAYLDQAKEGVILFSMGSVLKSKDMPKEKLDAIFKSFAKLKVKVLWKFETDLPGKPSNVKIMKWIPQPDVLAHPNVKAFMTHGGISSTIEAIHFGVPVIGIPIFGDQELNTMRSVDMGFAVSLKFPDLNEKSLDKALNEILNNKKYLENAKERSGILQDRPMKPLDTAVYWIEYAFRHKGSKHLRTAGARLPWYQYMLLDVFAFLLAILLGVIGASCMVLRFICKSRTKKPVVKGKKHN